MAKVKEKRKFLKTIYAIQDSFGVKIGGGSSSFPFGILPTKEEEIRLDIWFQQVNEAKYQLYDEIYKNFVSSPPRYFRGEFDYDTFFKGRAILNDIKKGRNLITSQPVMEGLRMEISGAIRSFITNHGRTFKENQNIISEIKKIIKSNEGILKEQAINPPERLAIDEFSKKVISRKYDFFKKNFRNLQQLDFLIQELRRVIGEYNYEINQISNKEESIADDLEPLPRLKFLPRFPGQRRKEERISPEQQKLLIKKLIEELRLYAQGVIPVHHIKSFLEKRRKKTERTREYQRRRFEDRLIAYLDRKFTQEVEKSREFLKSLEKKVVQSEKHFFRKPYDTQGRNRYFGLLGLKARIRNPEKEKEINELISKLKGLYLVGKEQKEIITLPGFSWKKGGKPQKNVAIAIKDNKLFICISASSKNFAINANGRNLLFLKTTGGQRFRKDAKQKTIAYVSGDFLYDVKEGLPLFLPLHFGKSYARRSLYQKHWGLLSKTPNIFLNNARLKREKKRPGDAWRYYLDVTLSQEEAIGFKQFSSPILQRAEAVVGVDRGEAKPIAYSVVRINDGAILESGFLAEEYTTRLMNYYNKRREYQSKGKTIPKYLQSKISRLQKTLLETATSTILALVGRYKGVVAIEDLGARFRGSERRIIPKKTYQKVEKLLADALHLSGLLRINQNPKYAKYWGALMTVYPAGTSQQCLNCGEKWNKEFVSEILKKAKKSHFRNIDLQKHLLRLNGETFKLNEKFEVFHHKKRFAETKSLLDLDRAIQSKDWKEAGRLLRRAIGPRISQDVFICARCGFQENADIVGATNVGRKGAESVLRLTRGS